MATPPAAEPRPVTVDASEISSLDEATVGKITREVTAVVLDQGLTADNVRVTLVWADRGALEYGIRVFVSTDQATLAGEDGDSRGPITGRCPGCTVSELADAAVLAVREGLRQYAELATRVKPNAQPDDVPEADAGPDDRAPAPAPVTPAPTNTDRAPSSRRPLGPIGWSGVGLLAVGASGIIAGGVLVGLGQRRIDEMPAYLRDFRRPGWASLGVGAGLVISGAALLVVDRVRARRTRAHARTRIPRGGRSAAVLAPTLSPGAVGLSASGAF